MKALFCSEAWLIENSIINENVSYSQLRPTLVKVQEMRIQSIVGTELYQELEGQIVSGTLTTLNTTLLNDYLRPAIREWLYFELPNVLAFKYMNKGKIRGRHLKMPHLFYSKADAVAYAQIKTDKRSPMPHICKFTLVPEMHTLEQVKAPLKTKFRIL